MGTENQGIFFPSQLADRHNLRIWMCIDGVGNSDAGTGKDAALAVAAA